MSDAHPTEDQVSRNLALFDKMDFEAFNKQDWELFSELHTADTRVVNADGSVTTGLAKHIEDMKDFSFLPDLQVEEHSVKVGQGDWTAVIGTLSGSFTAPLRLADGTEVPPNGRRVRIQMATFARWENGAIAEEILFYDNGEFMKQLGLA